MNSKNIVFYNWGRNSKIKPKTISPKNYNELKKVIKNKKFIVLGNKRSYGDVAINKRLLISMEKFNQIKYFDQKNGIIECESGVLLKDMTAKIIGDKWFVPITPGTKYVSLGGMVANNVHGKNIKNNQLKYFIKEIKLLKIDNKIIVCTKKKNKKIFDLTIGGYGLTGIIISVTLKLKKISSPFLDQKILEFRSYKQFFAMTNYEGDYDYSVYWIGNFSEKTIQGLNYLSKHSDKKNKKRILIKDKKINLFSYLVSKTIIKNYYISKLINLVFRKYKKTFYSKIVNYNEAFYPQDRYTDWNKIYGKNGFFEIQFMIPREKFIEILGEISFFLKQNHIFSPFVVFKKYNEKGKYLNFCGKGYSVSFDFEINENKKKLEKFFNSLFLKNELKVNFSKDLITNKKNAYNYPEFENFKTEISRLNKKKKLSSYFSERLGI
jgi:decaprenylphospho-beta-D-ribofuranose 2-oxidase